MPRIPRAEIRARQWRLPDVKRDREKERREFLAEARQAFREKQEAERTPEDLGEANLRAIQNHTGLSFRFLQSSFRTDRGRDLLESIRIDNRAVKSLFRKVDRMRAKGMTTFQIEKELLSRLNALGVDPDAPVNLLDLVREAYGTTRISGRFTMRPRQRVGGKRAA